jgi:transposase
MLSLPPSVRIFLCLPAADMRRSFDGLKMMAEKIILQDPFSGHLFVFANKRRDRVKVLYWDGDGFAIWYKRLEAGTFAFAESGSGGVEIEASRLMLILGGIDLAGSRRRRRYVRMDRP